MKIFISYSHRDEGVVERLITHMAALKREGVVQEWYDRKITAGSILDEAILGELEDSDLVLLIVSPDFIASDYCYERELARAREKAKSGELLIVPVIAEPCDWLGLLGDLKAIPKDGKPISEWTSQNTALLDVVQELRRIVEAVPRSKTRVVEQHETTIQGPQKYKVKRQFDEIDKAEFIENSFAEIRSYFEGASAEIEALDGIKARFTSVSDSEFACRIVNQNIANGRAFISVRCRSGGRHFSGDIDYSNSENASGNSSNGGFSVQADDYSLAWVGRISFSGSERTMSTKEVAEVLWKDFVAQAGIHHD